MLAAWAPGVSGLWSALLRLWPESAPRAGVAGVAPSITQMVSLPGIGRDSPMSLASPSPKAGYVQMNDWPRLAVDPKTTQKLVAEKTNCTRTNTLLITCRARLSRVVGFYQRLCRGSERTTPSVLDKYLS